MFNNITLNQKNIETMFKGKKLILKNIYQYNGPITLQYLPVGGIQIIYQGQMVINCNLGFIATKEVEYNGICYSVQEFSNLYKDLVNYVLPI